MESINPVTGHLLQEYPSPTPKHVEAIVNVVDDEFKVWRGKSIQQKANQFRELAKIIRNDKHRLAKIISLEMGKLLSEAYAEVDKCEWVCLYYADNAEEFLKPQHVETGAFKSYVRYDPLGVILLIMPWNYPFWQVLRAAIPILLSGNTILLKHASNVQGCAKIIEWSFTRAGFSKNIFRNLAIPSSRMTDIITDKRVRGVSFTGSETAGKEVAALAGANMKKCVMELGGSDPFIVLADANIELACKEAMVARMANSGQVCISSKRFLIDSKISEEFENNMKAAFEALEPAFDLSEDGAVYAPLAREDIRTEIHRQVEESVAMGARLVCGGSYLEDEEGFYYKPTILADVTPEMPAFKEETFGPLMAITTFDSDEEAVALANKTRFGLGASLWTENLKKGEKLAGKIEAGMVFINGIVRSDPRMPFGGIKDSGYGREISKYGIREFVNIKSVWID